MLLYYSTTAAARFGDNPQSPESKQASKQISRPGFRQIVIIIRSSKQQQHRSGGRVRVGYERREEPNIFLLFLFL
jgi:hypothetical protein